MNPDENLGLLEAARAIVAGRRVDWAAIESSGDPLSESLAALCGELKVVEDIAALHRSLPDSERIAVGRCRQSHAVVGRPSTPVAPPAVTWGSLRLLERVGQGAFGDVYRAWDPRLDREVALKLLRRPDVRHDPVGSARRSTKDGCSRACAIRTSSPCTAPTHRRRVGLWMEFVRGRTLEAVLHEQGPFGAQEAALIGLDICRALSAVHRAGLIHRDIKAQNVMREDGGRIVLMDFGTGREDRRAMRSRARRYAAVSRARSVRRRAPPPHERHLQRRRAAVPPRHRRRIRSRAAPSPISARRTRQRRRAWLRDDASRSSRSRSCKPSSARSTSIRDSAIRKRGRDGSGALTGSRRGEARTSRRRGSARRPLAAAVRVLVAAARRRRAAVMARSRARRRRRRALDSECGSRWWADRLGCRPPRDASPRNARRFAVVRRHAVLDGRR